MVSRLLFEDKESTPSSVLLKSSLNSEKIEFSEGNKFLKRSVNRIMKKHGDDALALVFVDVSSNNRNTLDIYDILLRVRAVEEGLG